MNRGHRYFRTRRGGVTRQFMLAGRGTKAQMQDEAAKLRKGWTYVRVVPAHPFNKFRTDVMDDWMVYVFEERVTD